MYETFKFESLLIAGLRKGCHYGYQAYLVMIQSLNFTWEEERSKYTEQEGGNEGYKKDENGHMDTENMMHGYFMVNM